jgi:signal transduction histidine kinase
MKNPFTRKISKAFKLSTLTLVLCSAISLITLNRAGNKEEWVQHTHLVIQRLEFLLSILKDAETGARGYIITKKPHTLAPYNHAEAAARKVLNDLLSLTRDNKPQQKSLRLLDDNITTQFVILADYVQKTQNNQTIDIAQIERGKEVMDQARKLTKEMEEREYSLLEQRNHSWHNTWMYIPFLIASLTALSIVSTIYFCRNLQINYFEKVKFRRKLQQQAIITGNRIKIIQLITAQVAGGNYGVRISGEKSDILGVLSNDVNKMTESLEQSFQKLNQLMQKKDEFINITAHEFRTPLTSIKAALQIIGRFKFNAEENDKLVSILKRANNQVKRITGILNDLIDVSNINNGELPLQFASFPISNVIEESIQDAQAGDSNLLFEITGPTETIVKADNSRIQQVLNNLISNAVKYSASSTPITIALTIDNEFLCIRVKDRGKGIPLDKLPFIFDRYFRVEETSQNYSGMGLGLYIAKGIVERHGGSIGVESAEEQGTTFWFTLPINS